MRIYLHHLATKRKQKSSCKSSTRDNPAAKNMLNGEKTGEPHETRHPRSSHFVPRRHPGACTVFHANPAILTHDTLAAGASFSAFSLDPFGVIPAVTLLDALAQLRQPQQPGRRA